MQMTEPFQLGTQAVISLEPENLPHYATRTILRMFIALLCSLLFTFTVAPLAAKNKHFERFIIPFIDFMESLPILGVLAISVAAFIYLFPNRMLGPECAAIFAIFTSQVWNMTLSLYQSLRTLPKELIDVAHAFHLSRWQRFWRIEVPFATPSLLWNTMISMSAGWFFVVASEAFTVAHQDITLPGLGAYIGQAIISENLTAIYYAIAAMFFVILAYDQLLFRPLLSWSEKFKSEISEEEHTDSSWFYDLLGKTNLLKYIEMLLGIFYTYFIIKPAAIFPKRTFSYPRLTPYSSKFFVILWYLLLALGILSITLFLGQFIVETVTFKEVMEVFYLGLITAIKVTLLVIIASIIWVPIGVWIGLHTKVAHFLQPLIQFLAAFPANFFYPLVVILILKYNLNENVWTTPLMILGTQWYILFNVIAGASTIPKDITLAAKSFGIKRWTWWKRLMLPAIFPYYTTGAMAAAGGCWNASILADVVEWGDNRLEAIGLGRYIVEQTTSGDYPRLALGIAVMSFYVFVINRLLWHKLYALAESRFSAE